MNKLFFWTKVFFFLTSIMLLTSCGSLDKKSLGKESLDKENIYALKGRHNKTTVVAKKVWIKETFLKDFTRPSAFQPIKPVLTNSGLLIQGNRVNGLNAYTLKRGKRKWFFPVKGGLTGDVLAKDDFLFFGGGDGFIYGLYLSTGQVLWKSYIGAIHVSQPTLKNGYLYFATVNKMYCLNAKTGERVWTYTAQIEPAEFTIEGIARPLVQGSNKTARIYFKSSDGSLMALNAKGQLKWKRKLSQSNRFTSALSAPVMGKRCLYSASVESGLYCLNKKTGKTIWKNSFGSHGELLLFGPFLFYSTSDGKILALDQKSGKQIWSHKLNKKVATSPVLYKDFLIYGEYSGALRFISRKTGKAIGDFAFGSGMSVSPVVSVLNSELYFFSNAGWLYKLKLLL